MEDTSSGWEVNFSKWLRGRRVYVKHLPRYVKIGEEDKVYRLKKALYRLKPAPLASNTRINAYLQKNGFIKSP